MSGFVQLQGRTALVTGAAQGMGRAVAVTLGHCGARLVVNDLDQDRLMGTVSDLGEVTEVYPYAADVTDASAVREMVDAAARRFGTVDILVNNAGVLRSTPAAEIPEDEWDFVVHVNLKGTFLCAKAVLPHMQRGKWGRIINFSSTAGKNVSTVGGAHYTAAKAAILGLTRHLANEVAKHGITVNAVCPGLIDTDMVRSTISPEAINSFVKAFPIQRLGRPEEVADLVAFLASDRAAYITGASLDINGGDLMI